MATWEIINENVAAALFPPEATADAPKWFAIQTRARHEKKVDTQLHEKGVESFLPLWSEMHQWSDRQRLVHQPLFSGYVFVHIAGTPRERMTVLGTFGVCWFVGNRGMGLSIPDKQIHDVQAVLSSQVPYAPFPFIRVGQHVRIRGGCLEGIEGILIAKESDRTVVVSVELVRRSLAVHINGYEIEEA